ncbi:MAG: AAA family ATPase [Candidatus Symbiothrix sp.]|jgi:predicted AAA+ superfamily ATPase|nr:AAA family ATPase [Candidatus Symbiothrix sp.]
MEELFEWFYRQLKKTDMYLVRYLSPFINWDSRLLSISGARGTGKTTMILQYIKSTYGNTPRDVLYTSLDHLWFSSNRLYDLAVEFDKMGGRVLFLDEVHKYPNWSQEIKNIYDGFPDLKVVISGSSMLKIYRGYADLSRRLVHYLLEGMSFREYLKMEYKLDFQKISLEDILKNHVEIASAVIEKIKPIPAFNNYLKMGYYPYYKEDKNAYHLKLANTINLVLESDLPAIENIELYSIANIKKLLWIISTLVPFTPNISELSSQIGISRNSLLNFLDILERAGLINLLTSDSKGINQLTKPEKIYLNNTNQIFTLGGDKSNVGNIRETFFFNQLKAVSNVNYTKITDFLVDDKYLFEVGGKSKGFRQIAGIENSYLAVDNTEYGFGNKIPLWLFGFLY